MTARAMLEQVPSMWHALVQAIEAQASTHLAAGDAARVRAALPLGESGMTVLFACGRPERLENGDGHSHELGAILQPAAAGELGNCAGFNAELYRPAADPHLPELAALIGLRPVPPAWLPPGSWVHAVQVRSYRPCRRAQVETAIAQAGGGEHQRWFVKLERPSSAARRAKGAAFVRRYLAQTLRPDLALPELVTADPARGLSVTAGVTGRSLSELLPTSQASAALARLGSALRELETEAGGDLPGYDLATACIDLGRFVRLLARLELSLAAAIARGLAVLADFAPDSSRRAIVHRDLHDGQVFLGQRVVVLDWDSSSAGDPAIDLGNLCAHLELRSLQGRLSGPAAPLAEALLAGYAPRGEPDFRPAVEVWTAASLLRLAAVYALRPRYAQLGSTLVAAAFQALARARGSTRDSPICIPIAAATTPELVELAIAERIEPGLAPNRWRRDYAEFKEKRRWAELHQKTLVRKLEAALGDLRGRRILDLGTGRGGLAVALARKGCEVVAVDLRRRNLETTVLRGRRYDVVPQVATGAAEHLPFASGTFDLVICKDVLEHCASPAAVLAEIRRVIAPDGVAYLTVVNRLPFKDPHYHLWFVNFLPACLGDRYIDWRGRSKRSFRDCQRLADMHYFLLPRFRRLAADVGLRVRSDLRRARRPTAKSPSHTARLRSAVGAVAYRAGAALSVGVECFELLLERAPGRPPSLGARALLVGCALVLGSLLNPNTVPVGRADSGFELGGLRPGIRVEVRGKRQGDRFSASRVTLKPDSGRDIEIKAPIEPEPAPNQSQSTIRLLGRSVTFEPDAKVDGAASLPELLAATAPGSWVKVRGRDRGDWIAVEAISLRQELEGSAEIEGPIEKVKARGSQTLVEIGGFDIEVDSDARFITEGDMSATLGPRVVDDDDARPRHFHWLNGRIAAGGQLRWDLGPASNLDLDEGVDDDETASAFSAQGEINAVPTQDLEVFVKSTLFGVVGLREPEGLDLGTAELRLEEAYLAWRSPVPWIAAQIGRQDFDEPREWLYDENLDALRLYLQPGPRLHGELSVTGQLSAEGIPTGRVHTIASGRVDLVRKFWGGGYLINRHDSEDDDKRWLGVRAGGSPWSGLEPWAELAILRGNAPEGRSFRGTAIDLGGTIDLCKRMKRGQDGFRPAFTIGYARGSGDDDGADAYERTFRQTGFQDNTDSFSGVTSFNFYGELLDPELSNLEIWTVGAGFHLARRTSIDLVYHRYRQVTADDRIRADLTVEPTGEDPFIGSGVDLILGMEELGSFEVELDLAAFLPGRAFAPPAATATRASLQLKWNF